jgi:hypothetical protein
LPGFLLGRRLDVVEAVGCAPRDSSGLSLLVRAIADACLAARLRLGPGAVRGGVWAFCSAATQWLIVRVHERAPGSGS